MRNFNAFRLSMTASAMALGVAMATPAFAQAQSTDPQPAPGNGPNQAPQCAKPEGQPNDNCTSGEVETKSGVPVSTSNSEAIVVTGSRIRRPNLESPVPITSLSAEELTMTGEVNVGDRLNDLPALRSTFSQSNSTRFIGTAGVNELDLRGLGDSRTLVLVNGKRHITYTPGDFIVDINTIPTDLIERVDIVTGGEAAVYGSDAVAGVVNFILKNNFHGLKIRAQSGISTHGDRPVNFVSLTGGRNFGDGRGNIAINLEYARAQPLYFRQRPSLTGAFTGRCQFNLSSFTAGEPQSGNGVPDSSFFCGVRNATISNGGTLTALAPPSLIDVNGAAAGNGTIACNDPRALNPAFVTPAVAAARCNNPGTPEGTSRIVNFLPNGAACIETPALDFRPFGSGNYIRNPNSTCAPGATLRDTGQLAPGLKRYMGNLLFHYDISDAFQPFVEAKAVRVDALQQGQPSFFQSTFPAFFGGGRGIRCDNPFLTAQDIATLQTIGRCSGGATSTETLPLSRFNVDFGGRAEVIRRDTYRVVAGVQGDFNEDWHYEVSANYGHLKSTQAEHNDLFIFNSDFSDGPFLQAIDAVRNSAGQIVCRVNRVTVTNPACVPINVFGEGSPSPEALAFVNRVSHVYSSASELDLLAFMSGDTSQAFSLPGGPVRFVLGAEHREERASQHADPISANSQTFFNAFSAFHPPAFKVTEGFGELEVPILSHVRFAEELTLQGAARYSHYNTSAKNTFAWNVNGVWGPVRDIKFRANYSKSVRVPTLSDLFSSPSVNFGFVGDPCDVLNINNGTANRQTNCLAVLGPALINQPGGFVNQPARSQTTEFLSAGNPNLTAETGRSLTIGTVITPRFLPGFSASIDYYRIRVMNLISVLGAQTILNECFDLPQPNQFCSLINPRNPDGTFASPALTSAGVNFAKQQADGIDFEVAYRRTFANRHRLNIHFLATDVLKRNNFTDPTNPNFMFRQLSNLGDAKWNANLNVGYGFGPVDFTYTMNYIGKQTVTDFANTHSVQGRPPQNPDATSIRWYPEVMYHNARVDFHVPQAGRKLDFYVGVDNMFDTRPPLGLLGTGGGEPYDPVGRFVFGGVSIDL